MGEQDTNWYSGEEDPPITPPTALEILLLQIQRLIQEHQQKQGTPIVQSDTLVQEDSFDSQDTHH